MEETDGVTYGFPDVLKLEGLSEWSGQCTVAFPSHTNSSVPQEWDEHAASSDNHFGLIRDQRNIR